MAGRLQFVVGAISGVLVVFVLVVVVVTVDYRYQLLEFLALELFVGRDLLVANVQQVLNNLTTTFSV